MQSMIFSVREVCSDSVLVIDSITTAGFTVILDFIYTGEYQFEPVLYHDVLEAARYLGMTEFENICRENVVEPGNNFSNSHEVESKCVMPDFAPNTGLKELILKELIHSNLKLVMMTIMKVKKKQKMTNVNVKKIIIMIHKTPEIPWDSMNVFV